MVMLAAMMRAQNYTQILGCWPAIQFWHLFFSADRPIINILKITTTVTILVGMRGDASLDNMEQRYIQWGNSVEVGHGAVSGWGLTGNRKN
ncbi:Uncharacterised protein [Salmonella enterica subsp. enterica]|uniref:Uncharacterized protein n=1 Tax=Salmonella enterica I TaxID=59201 RepID=A0A379W0J6_SALET|nr:Uncharacterised protein [Salmonella enterica subsp. enterica]